jgi:hypothetical protein
LFQAVVQGIAIIFGSALTFLVFLLHYSLTKGRDVLKAKAVFDNVVKCDAPELWLVQFRFFAPASASHFGIL